MSANEPTWRNGFVVAVRQLCDRPGALEHFRAKFRSWQENSTRIQEAQRAYQYANDRSAPEQDRHRLLHRLDGGPLSVDEAYVYVVLLYDTFMPPDFPSHKIGPQLAFERNHAGYIVTECEMANDPPNEADQALVFEALDTVRRDLDASGISDISSRTESPQQTVFVNQLVKSVVVNHHVVNNKTDVILVSNSAPATPPTGSAMPSDSPTAGQQVTEPLTNEGSPKSQEREPEDDSESSSDTGDGERHRLSRQQRIASRDKRIRCLCNDHNLNGKWAKLAEQSNADPDIKSLDLKDVTRHVARNAVIPANRRRKKRS